MCSKLYQHDYNLYSYPCSFSATSSVQPRTWQGGRGEQDVYGNPRPFQYMRALRPTDPQIYPNVRNQVQVESPRSYQQRSNIPTNRPMETSLVQPRAHRNNLVAKHTHQGHVILKDMPTLTVDTTTSRWILRGITTGGITVDLIGVM